MIDAPNDQHLWAQTYERHRRDVLSWQSEVARSIAQQIEVTFTPREDARLSQVHSVDPEAHAAYLRGRYYWHQSFTEAAFKTAIAHFRRATDLDPGYARAWSGMADCFGAMAVQSMLPPKEGASEAEHAAEKALALDPSLAEAHTSRAGVQLFFEWNWASAERALRSAMGSVRAIPWRTLCLRTMRRRGDGRNTRSHPHVVRWIWIRCRPSPTWIWPGLPADEGLPESP